MTRPLADLRYLHELTRLRCAPDMLALGLFPNAKEVTESFAAYHAVVRHLPAFSLSDRSVTLIAVGDGSTPRTGATFALRSAWNCISIDPALRETGGKGARGRPPSRGWSAIGRLRVIPLHVQFVEPIECERAVIVAVHSHARLEDAMRAVRAREIAVVAMPCCVPQTLETPHDIEFTDSAVASPQNRILVWHNVRRPS